MDRVLANIIVEASALEANEDLIPLLFGDEDVLYISPNTTMPDLLAQFGLFKSKSEARKNWKRTGIEIPGGWTALENIGKLNHCLWIWKPI